eukprot:gene44280-55060_t
MTPISPRNAGPAALAVSLTISLAFSFTVAAPRAAAQQPAAAPAASADPVAALVNQLDLEKYKATIKSLTRFGDRRQGTERNRQALDWIEAQLKSYGCTNTERVQYQFTDRDDAAMGNVTALPQIARL